MNAQMRTGAVYSFFYSGWKTNLKIYAFIMYAGPASNYAHALNLGAVQLSNFDRIKVIRVIQKLSKVQNSTYYNGFLLYKIFKTYLRNEMNKCYRRYKKHAINRVALLNYGINKKSEFSETEIKMFDRSQYAQANNDYIVKMMNMYTNKKFDINEYRNNFADAKGSALMDSAKQNTSNPDINTSE